MRRQRGAAHAGEGRAELVVKQSVVAVGDGHRRGVQRQAASTDRPPPLLDSRKYPHATGDNIAGKQALAAGCTVVKQRRSSDLVGVSAASELPFSDRVLIVRSVATALFGFAAAQPAEPRRRFASCPRSASTVATGNWHAPWRHR